MMTSPNGHQPILMNEPRPFNKDWDTVIAAPYRIGLCDNETGTWTINHAADWDLVSERNHDDAVRWWFSRDQD